MAIACVANITDRPAEETFFFLLQLVKCTNCFVNKMKSSPEIRSHGLDRTLNNKLRQHNGNPILSDQKILCRSGLHN